MRLVVAEVMSERPSSDATNEEVAAWMKRRKVAERWREAPAHWLVTLCGWISSLPEIVVLGVQPTMEDAELEQGSEAIDAAILTAIRNAVDEWKDKV